MDVLAFASYPVEAAATRFRVAQFVGPLAERGIGVRLSPFLDARLFESLYRRSEAGRTALGLTRALARRAADVWRARSADVLFVQREAMLFGPPVFEWLATKVGGCPMVLDLDDATYVRYDSPTYGRAGAALKWFTKTDELIRRAAVVTCGNRNIAEYVRSKGGRAVVIPTVVDTEEFRPAAKPEGGVPLIGWVGTHSTFPFLKSIFPVLEQLARTHRFRLRIVGAGAERPDVPGVETEYADWSLAREVEDFRSLDVGLYPLSVARNAPPEWLAGKSGFKAVQYMAVGVPFVVTPVGVCAEMGEPGKTHLAASAPEEWRDALAALISDAALRRRMGAAGRRHALENYGLPEQAEKLAAALREARDTAPRRAG
ncbi:MAG TPA: glycosyltransferase family 4 protein [Pyrinomonadaceae bacterium]|nr:glycosyltransferase family 4 protein [Pyrinomonadaceae bacterium]